MIQGLFQPHWGMFILVILALDAWAIYRTTSTKASLPQKIGWSTVILVLPLFGLVIWALAGPKTAKPPMYNHEPP